MLEVPGNNIGSSQIDLSTSQNCQVSQATSDDQTWQWKIIIYPLVNQHNYKWPCSMANCWSLSDAINDFHIKILFSNGVFPAAMVIPGGNITVTQSRRPLCGRMASGTFWVVCSSQGSPKSSSGEEKLQGTIRWSICFHQMEVSSCIFSYPHCLIIRFCFRLSVN